MFAEYNHFMKKILIVIFGLYIGIIPCEAATRIAFAGTFDSKNPTLLITEIMPNPKGADKGKEWLELYNATQQRVSLDNWKLSNGKIFAIPEGLSILPNDYFILQGSNLKMTLKNSNAALSLLDPNEKTIQEISFQKSVEDQSYSLINIKTPSSTKHTWIWTPDTKGKKNPTFYQISGKIVTPPQIEKDFYFEIGPENSKKDSKLTITFAEDRFGFELLQTLLRQDTQASFLLEKSSNKYILKDFKVINSPSEKLSAKDTAQGEEPDPQQNPAPQKTHWEYFLIFPITVLIIIAIFLQKQKKS